MNATSASRRIVFTTFGSLGDLHPYIAIALALRARGHMPVIATSAYYCEKIEKLGIEFRPLRPDYPDLDKNPDVIRKIMNLRGGSEYVIRDLTMPVLDDTYQDTLEAARDADLLVSHVLTFTTPLAAEKLGLPWASTFLQPLGLFSVYDPPVLPPAPFLRRLHFVGPWLHSSLFWLARLRTKPWCEPVQRLRAKMGLAPSAAHPLFEGSHSPRLVLCLFSKLLAEPQRDWPKQTVITGFPFFDQENAAGLSAELQQFLNDGPPPLVFTLGSSAVLDAGRFYEQSAEAARLLGRRAVLLVGKKAENRPVSLPKGVATFDYAPFSELMPRAAAIVHQGGVGTTAQAMRSGRPMLVMPYAHDQPDNAARVTRLGIARTIPRRKYTAKRAAAELRVLLGDPCYEKRASEVGAKVRQEDGANAACDALERLLKV